jgi:UDP-GlcNAc3NAcA epimerase
MKKILSIVGARPQFIKHAPLQIQLQKKFNAKTIHTGQHYDFNMSEVFFNELKIPKPDYLFDINGLKFQGEQTAQMMINIEKICIKENPNALLIYGDTNSTLAGCIVAAKMHIPIIHIEAGLRSFNREMPEEVNRIIADTFASLLFCPTKSSLDNLKKEGITHDNIFLSGDVMCDMLHLIKPLVQKKVDYPYFFATIHRPYNTDNIARLLQILTALNQLNKKVIFSIHPRTIAKMKQDDLNTVDYQNIIFIDPVGYADSISYQTYADAIITDSGGIQKEAYMLQKKCVTLRSETEWIETLNGGWNTLVYNNLNELSNIIETQSDNYIPNLFGNGNAAEEIAEIINVSI